jgi:kynurenine formamidase
VSGPSNWGRWGADDERGALNLVSAAGIIRAAGLVRQGRTISLGLPVRRDNVPFSGIRSPAMHFMTLDGGDFAAGVKIGGGTYQAADDYLFMACAGSTHVDALAHFWYDGQLYNGHSADRVRSYGATRCGIENVAGLATRGVLLDVAAFRGVDHLAGGEAITASDLQACAEAADVDVGPGDCVLIRTGWLRVFHDDPAGYDQSQPGIDTSAARWLAERDVCAIGADNFAVEVLLGPMTFEGDAPGPVSHRFLIRDCGIYLIELLDLEELSAAAAAEFLFVLAPLKIEGGVNSPVNPLVIL